MNGYVVFASFMGTTVEFIEALTIILAVGMVKGWRSSFAGMGTAVVVLALLVALFGVPLTHLVHVFVFQFLIGLFMLLFGIRWLRKAILRYAGLKELHLEDAAFEKELARQRSSGALSGKKIDAFGFATAFNGVFLEGLESIFIVITFGVSAHSLSSAVAGSIIGLILVALVGVILRKPLSMIPENTMKYIVGIMLSGFGIFWIGEGIGVHWWNADVSIPVILVILLIASLLTVGIMKSSWKNGKSAVQSGKSAGGSL